MKCVIVLFSLVSLYGHAQSLEYWNAKRKHLLMRQMQINDSLKIVDEAILKLKVEKLRNESPSMTAIIANRTWFKKNEQGDADFYLKAGDTVEVIASAWSDLKVLYDGKVGYVYHLDIVRNKELDSFIEILEAKYKEEEKKKVSERWEKIDMDASEKAEKNKKEQDARVNSEKRERAKLISSKFDKYGNVVVQKIIDGKIWVGMTDDMAISSWGKPNKINKTVSSFGAKEQWVYNDEYLYFEDGKLVTFQTSR